MRHRWLDRLVFAFKPHTSYFVATPDELLPLPDGISPEMACFLPNMETAANLVQDGAPILGERAFVLGQGIVGLLTAALLAEFPLQTLITADCYRLRREASIGLGANSSFDPDKPDFPKQVSTQGGYDLTFELSGSPSALNNAIALTGFGGRVVIGSWYGEKKATLDLGGEFHRSRIKLISSQVSTISPELSARWDKARRFKIAWDALKRIQPQKWITHRFPLKHAGKAYKLLDEQPQETIQIIFTYIE
jgi:threonine dehydrogenase-like Zn-dependent dehydrogenase